ncbi:MAG: hypothetical protein K0S12_1995 [Bacteroidetes bacterium]|nr:hypothetical protein [Bacteroidota bacterium]
MKSNPIYSSDPRIAKVLEILSEFKKGNFRLKGDVSEKDDEIDEMVKALNDLGDTILGSSAFVKNYDARINHFLEVLVKYTAMDFSEKAELSGEGDELDAMAVGLNTLAEELVASRAAEAEQFERLKESEARYRTLVEGVKDYAIFTLDPNGNVQNWNAGAQQIKGYTAEEIIGKHISTFYTDEELQRGEPEFNLKSAAEHGSFRTEGLRKRKDGSTFYADILITALRDNAGKLTGFSKITRDVTELKKSEELVKESRDQVESILSNAPNGVVVIDQRGNIIRWNSKSEAIFGWTTEEVMNKPMHEFIMPPQHVSAHHAGVKNFIRTGEGPVINKTIEITALRKDKTEFPIELSISATKSKGEYIFIAFINDITERKRIQDEIRTTRDFLDTILENIPNMVFVKDAKDLRYIRFNRAGEQLLGHTKSELIGKNDYDFFPKKQADFFTAKDREVLSKQEITDIPEEPISTPKGELWLHTRKMPILDDHGNPLYLLGISEDITRRKINEGKIKRLNKELLNNIAKLETANKELESFSYSVSHDLRAPLRAIHGYTSILMEEHSGKLDEEARTMMNSIQSNAKKMGQLIDDLLAFSRLGRKEIEKKQVDMNKLVEAVIPEVSANYPNTKPQFIIHPLAPASVDYNLMSQVFTNLISNAIKYSSHAEKPLIEIGSRISGKFVEYYVKDNGIGFNMAYYNKLFGVFQRLHDSTEFEGTGVGLAIVKRIVNKHGGKVWAESEPGKGATFYISLKKEDSPAKKTKMKNGK